MDDRIKAVNDALTLRGRQTAIPDPDNTAPEPRIIVHGRCILSGVETETKPLSLLGVEAWLGGQFIQHALPDASLDDREFLISGTNGAAFDAAFAEDADETE